MHIMPKRLEERVTHEATLDVCEFAQEYAYGDDSEYLGADVIKASANLEFSRDHTEYPLIKVGAIRAAQDAIEDYFEKEPMMFFVNDEGLIETNPDYFKMLFMKFSAETMVQVADREEPDLGMYFEDLRKVLQHIELKAGKLGDAAPRHATFGYIFELMMFAIMSHKQEGEVNVVNFPSLSFEDSGLFPKDLIRPIGNWLPWDTNQNFYITGEPIRNVYRYQVKGSSSYTSNTKIQRMIASGVNPVFARNLKAETGGFWSLDDIRDVLKPDGEGDEIRKWYRAKIGKTNPTPTLFIPSNQ